MYLNKSKIGFTLAEILITLSIIGVIASMTIPSLVQDVQDAQYKTAWKKAYSDLDQATKKIMLDNGGNLKGLTRHMGTLCPIYKKYLNYIKYCGSAGCCSPATGCIIKKLNNQVENGNGTTQYWSFDDGQLVLNSGMLLIVNNSGFSGDPDILWMDVNGYKKGPNMVGKDILGAQVTNYGLKPLGSQGDGYENTCSTTSTGWGCSAKYLYQ